MTASAPPSLSFIGCGKLGQTLGRLWSQQGVLQIGQILTRSAESAAAAVAFIGAGQAISDAAALRGADAFILGCSDDQLDACVALLAANSVLKPGTQVFHCSGARPSQIMAVLKAGGAHLASVHPVKSFAAPALAAQSFAGTWCGFEGEAASAPVKTWFEAIGGRLFEIDPAHKTLYHSASVIACNYFVALQEISLRCFEAAGVERAQALQILQPILQGTLDNLLKLGPVDALTGPIARGDVATVERHQQALRQWQPPLAQIYNDLGSIALSLSRQQGKADAAALQALQTLLQPHH